jgi:molybdopterin synthase catalytic subunit
LTLPASVRMAISIWEASITDAPLERPDQLCDAASGAVVEFWGVVRGVENGREIEGIYYEVNRAMAEHQMNSLAEKAAIDFSLTQLVIRHRIGFVKAAEVSLFLRAASSHRPAAFAASQWLIDELKRKVPIWKRPVFAPRELRASRDNAKCFEQSPGAA